MSAHTLPELYETLTSGGKFRLRFNTHEEANAFRSRLATHKFRVEKDLKDMGVIEHMTLSMDYANEVYGPTGAGIATFYLREPNTNLPTFEVLEIIPPDTITVNPEDIS